MTSPRFSRAVSTAVSLALVASFAMPASALAMQAEVMAGSLTVGLSDSQTELFAGKLSSSEPSGCPTYPDAHHLVDIHCAQTARDEFSEEDLEFLLDLVVHKLEPQAVELLLDRFPAFRTAADQGQIGREIGLYVYCMEGDDDGVPEHATASV